MARPGSIPIGTITRRFTPPPPPIRIGHPPGDRVARAVVAPRSMPCVSRCVAGGGAVSRWHQMGGRVSESMRAYILARSDVCWICGVPGADTIDHRIPLVMGGGNEFANLAPAHRGCNSARQARTILPPARIARPGPPTRTD